MPVVKPDRDPTRLALLWAQGAAKAFARLADMDPGKPPDPDNLRGFIDGLRRREVPYPDPTAHLPGIRPEFGKSYERGYDAGEAFADAAEIFNHPEVAEKWLPLKLSKMFEE
jgi:hypothetical protein